MLTRSFRRLIATYVDAFQGLPRTVWWLSLALLVNRAGTMVLPFLSLYLTQQIGLEISEAGKLVALFGVGSVTGSAIGGWVSDRVDPMRVQRWTLVLTAALMLALIGVESVRWLGVLFFLVGLVGDAFRPAMMVAATRAAPPELRTRSFALIRLAANAGMAIGPATGGWLASYDYDLLFVVDAATCLGAAVVLLFTLRSMPRPAGEEAPATVTASFSPLRDAPFMLFMVAIFAVAISFFQVFTVLPLHLRDDYGLAESGIGSILALNAGLIVLVEMILLRRLEHVDPLRIAAVGGLLIGGGLAMLPLGPPLAFAIAATVVWSFGEMLLLPISTVIVSNRGGHQHTGGYMGVYMVTFGAAFVVAPWAGTWVYQNMGAGVLWSATGVIGVLVAAGYEALRPWLRESARPGQSA
ncbi:MAG: MFS transporter [Gemmatimonadetes bacterium]|nr:MFS transporter [Gemmatimonadota bacterium]